MATAEHDPVATAEEAEEAVVLASADPVRAREFADGVLASRAGPEARAVALRALGLVAKEFGDSAGAARHLRRAVRVAERAGLGLRAAQARMSMVVVLAERGETDSALAEAQAAEPFLQGVDQAQLVVHRALVLQVIGRTAEALDCYRRALPVLRRAGDERFEAGLLLNRGVLYGQQGTLPAAERDLLRCVAVAERAGLRLLATMARHNLAFVAVRRGDIPAALETLDTVLAGYTDSRLSLGNIARVHWDRAEALMYAGLASEARKHLERAEARLEEMGFGSDAAEARLLHAQAALADSDPAEAMALARAARAAFRRQHRYGWAALADHVEVRARYSAGERSEALLAAGRRAVRRLEEAGWSYAAMHTRIVVGRLLLSFGRRRYAAREFDLVATARRNGPAELRVAAWHAEALLRLARGQRWAANRALRAGMRVVDEYATSLGATDLRVHAAGYGQELAALGVRLALEDRGPRAVLDWIERYRAGALRRPPVRPPADQALTAALTALRGVVTQLAEATAAGADTRRLRAEQVRLERAVRDQSRYARGTDEVAGYRFDFAESAARLGERILIEYAYLDNQLYAVTVRDGRTRMYQLGAYDTVLPKIQSMRFAMHRLARRHGSMASQDAARLSLKHLSHDLDDLLLEPLRGQLADREAVLVPTMALHALPWPLLPTLDARPVSVAPSAAVWTKAASRNGPATGHVMLAAGPNLNHAESEVARLAAQYAEAIQLTGDAATADAVAAAMDGAELAHIAAHGHFRADNPLFSNLELADGPLTVYDLERLHRAPRRMVLSACDSALSDVRPGDELMGLSAAVFALGTSTLIASVTPVHDEDSQRLMLAVHQHLAAGVPPAQALASVQKTTGIDGFVCFGAG